MTAYKHIVILTGAGVSVESGIRPFRGPNGIWSQSLINDVATPGGFNSNPELAHDHYNQSRAAMRAAEPNATHIALARLAAEYPGRVTIITQNVDDLHMRAQAAYPPKKGAQLIPMHGELMKARKMKYDEAQQCWQETGEIIDCPGDITKASPDVVDGRLRSLRPHVVWFGEETMQAPEVMEAINDCDLFIAAGTSGHVPPANMFPYFVKQGKERTIASARTIEINPQPTGDSNFDEVRPEAASIAVPQLVDELLREARKQPWTEKSSRGDKTLGR